MFIHSDTLVSSLEPCPVAQFDASKFTCLTADILRFLTKLTGITNEVRKFEVHLWYVLHSILTTKLKYVMLGLVPNLTLV